jgi:hypothetical protein
MDRAGRGEVAMTKKRQPIGRRRRLVRAAKRLYFRRLPAFRLVEGVPYYPFRVTWKTACGRRRRCVFWSPGEPWLHIEVARALDDEYGLDAIAPGSCTNRRARP